MKKQEEIAYLAALEKLKQLELENEKLKSENSKISLDLTNTRVLYNSTSAQLKKQENKVKNLKHDNANKDKIIANKDILIARKDAELEYIRKYLIEEKILKKKAVNAIFGKASAKTKNLINKYIEETNKIDSSTDSLEKIKKENKEVQTRGRKKGTQNFDVWNESNYERREEHHSIPEGKRTCNVCGGETRFLRQDTDIKISIIPSHIRQTINITDVYECINCGEIIKAENKNHDCFGESACTPSLAGYLALLSCGAYLPANRISEIFNYNETPISRELITRYLIKTGQLLNDFTDLLRRKMQQADVLMFDETTWNALKDDKTETNRIWGMTTGPKEEHQAVYFMYSSTREKKNFDKIIDSNFNGAIVSDSYSAYAKQELHQLCWSHLRKYLFDYLNAVDNNESEDYRQIKELLDKCNLVFAKERELSNLPLEELKKRRIKELKPLIDDYFLTAEKYYNKDIQDQKNKAINYGLKNKDNYYLLVDNPKIPCTNNRSETQMRKVVMKRVGSMFSTSVIGAESMCNILSLVQSARMNGISPDKYICILLENIDDLKDERVAIAYLPWSKTLKEKIGFTKEEIEEAERELSKN